MKTRAVRGRGRKKTKERKKKKVVKKAERRLAAEVCQDVPMPSRKSDYFEYKIRVPKTYRLPTDALPAALYPSDEHVLFMLAIHGVWTPKDLLPSTFVSSRILISRSWFARPPIKGNRKKKEKKKKHRIRFFIYLFFFFFLFYASKHESIRPTFKPVRSHRLSIWTMCVPVSSMTNHGLERERIERNVDREPVARFPRVVEDPVEVSRGFRPWRLFRLYYESNGEE